MSRAGRLMVVALLASQLMPVMASAAYWESQPQARIWLKQVDPDSDKRQSDAERLWVAAEVRGVDLPDMSLTVDHGPIARVGMPAMTMTFPVRDTGHLRMLKSGDRIEIQVAEEGGAVKIINVKMAH